MATNPKPLTVALMGPTASGKTTTALEIVRHIPSEIISVDSALIYRGMDIGTAKPSRSEQALVPHHLIDILDPAESYSVMQFRQDALRLVAEIIARGKMPLLVGGTMLYFKSLQNGLDALPQADPIIRARLDQEAAQIGVPALHAKLAKLDPEIARRLQPNDNQRIQRALEVIELSGRPMSQLLLLAQSPKAELPFEVLPIALEPSDRSALHARIAKRFDAMLDDGFIAEVSALRERGDLHLGLPSMRCVGYRQVWEYLDGAIDLSTLREKGIAATRQLAKRQLTWLRSMPNRIVIDCLTPSPALHVLAKLNQVC